MAEASMLHVRVPPALKEAAEKAAAERRQLISEFIRDAIRDRLRRSEEAVA